MFLLYSSYTLSAIGNFFHITPYEKPRNLTLLHTQNWGVTLLPNKIKQVIFAYLFQKNEAKFHTPVGELKFPNSLPNFYPIPGINGDNLR